MKKRNLFFCLFILLFNVAIFSQDNNFEEVEINKIAFDENSVFGVYQKSGDLIVNFDRFENKNSSIKSIKIFNDAKDHIYTISVDDINQIIFVMSNEGKRGNVAISSQLKGFSIDVLANVQFFNKPYDLKIDYKFSFKEFSSEYIIQFDSEKVLLQTVKGSFLSGSEKTIKVNSEYLSNNKMECGVWVLILMALDELNRENQKSGSHSD